MARKILLADDSVTAQNMGRKILADAGYEVIAVNNGSAALKKIAELKPDLAILDVYMPGYSGLEVCQRLKEAPDTALIPVLLSVGKLEPFKPEEAQRVRAGGYIVKPFEASELLSALAKLEDKIVPRAEPSKPGRFARAIAVAEETSRGNQADAPNEQGAWKSRIGFPQEKEKTAPEEKFADDASIYNPMNRDLRTVVETPAEKLAEKGNGKPVAEKPVEVAVENNNQPQPSAAEAETSVDVAALAPQGLPNDVTPEEIAAIAAAAAQIQMASATLDDRNQASETPSEKASPTTLDHNQEQEPPEPMTMAATPESATAPDAGASRWTAVSIALEADETAISLEQEMQKAYAAFHAEQPDSAPAAIVPEEQPPAEISPAVVEAAAEAPVATISNSQPEAAAQPEPAGSVEFTQALPDFGASSEAATPASASAEFAPPESASLSEPVSAAHEQSEAAISEPVTAESAAVETVADASTTVAEPHQEPAPGAEFVNPVEEAEIAAPAELAAEDWQPAPETELPVAQEVSALSSAFAPIVRDAEYAVESKLDPEAVKSTAAAWASWRQIRDTSQGAEIVSRPRQDEEIQEIKDKDTESAPPDTAAMAVAAGAEQILQEVSAAPSNGSSADVASIVESVLADLRPKLMEEISRKMAEKK